MKVLEDIRERIGLNQSVECLEIGLVYSYLYQTIATKELAKKMGVPVPIATAFKKELVKKGWMKRESFYSLTKIGSDYVREELKFKGINSEFYKEILTITSKKELFLEEVNQSLTEVFEKRPVVKRELDQAHATLETVKKRVGILLDDPLIFSKKLAFVGDDDLVSLFLSASLEALGANVDHAIVVYDLDRELLAFIKEHESKKVPIKVIEQDVRDSLKQKIAKVDIVLTDPPYTPEGILTFIDFGESLLKTHGKTYASFNHKTPEIQGFIQKEMHLKGLNLIEIIPGFNHYLGGSIIGNVSNLYVLQKNDMTQTMKSSLNFYTKNVKKTRDSQRLGFHTLFELRECEEELLKSVELVSKKMSYMAEMFHLNVVEERFHQFMPYGVSGVLILKESHFTIHTWPEHQYAAVDLFICHDSINEVDFMKELQKEFNSKQCELKKIYRAS